MGKRNDAKGVGSDWSKVSINVGE